jgi:hypothetical protein
MAEELGRIEKPEARQFAGKKKLYLVPLLYSWQDAPAEYTVLFDIYWQQVREHLGNLESKIGRIIRIFHESVDVGGEDGLKLLERLSPASCRIAREKSQSGAQLEATEDTEIVKETMDWERHLLMGFVSEKAAQMVSDFFAEASKKRFEHIAKQMSEVVKDNEVALLFIRESHRVQFPPDMEVFSVFPPALNDIHRWLRDYKPEEETEETKE